MARTEFLSKIISRIDRVDRKHLEEHLLNLIRDNKALTSFLNAIPEGLLVFDREGRILFVNRRMVQLFNLPEVPDGGAPEILQDPPLIEWIRQQVRRREEMFQKEFDVLLPRPMTLDITLTFENMERGEAVLLLVRNLGANELRARQHFQNQQLETLLGLAAGIAHEIGNPINSISIHLQLLEKDLAKLPRSETGGLKKWKDSLTAIQEETRRLDRIIRNFLAAVRRKPLRFESCQIHEILKKTALLLEPELRAAKIRMTHEWDERIPEFLMDSERIQQVFINIIKNAVQAMPKGGALKIKTRLKDRLCLISFQDTGVGITEQDLPKIFDAYYTTREGGSGLGLMIVYQIVREHGGRIEVTSKQNAGTKLTLFLPLRKEKLRLPGPAGRGGK